KKEFKNIIKNKLKFLSFARIHFISAIHKTGIFNLFQSIDEAYENSIKTISTAKLTTIMYEATRKHAPPFNQGRRIKLKYAHLGQSNPLIIIIHGNQVNYLSSVYKKYLTKFYHNVLNIKGSPIHIKFKESINPYEKK
ncbi:ribosome biogenesis GTPase Der, partial [Buchnera aphidicola]|nr:ribosome biogenesis GTPase Der [Buchnera aphidicola]